ncbi:MAG: arginine repressor [Gemmatimonadaceae bacterium]
MPNKKERQATILELVEARPVGSQEELRRLLRRRGWDVTQATLSRDIRDLRLARVPSPAGGVRYTPSDSSREDTRANLDAILPTLFRSIDAVAQLAVLRTAPGAAQPVAAGFDAEVWPDLVGTIAGDDTVLLICRSEAARERAVRRIESLAARSGG